MGNTLTLSKNETCVVKLRAYESQSKREELKLGFAIALTHATPFSLMLFLSNISLAQLSMPALIQLGAMGLIQFVIPASVLSYISGKNCILAKLMWLSLVMGGIINGILFEGIMR